MEKDLLDQLNAANDNDTPVEALPELPDIKQAAELAAKENEAQEAAKETPDNAQEDSNDTQGVVLDEDEDAKKQDPVEDIYDTVVDLVMCIDVTGSMDKLQAAVKDFAVAFPKELMEKLEDVGRHVTNFRLRVIAFRDFFQDYKSSKYPACEMSDFFRIVTDGVLDEAESSAFTRFVEQLECRGGGREAAVDPESSLEALHLAFTSDWNDIDNSPKKRRIVMLFTDSVPHDLNDQRRDQEEILHPITGKMGYPQDCPRTLSALRDEYIDLGDNKRLQIYGRDCEVWQKLGGWNLSQFWCDNEEGLTSIDKDVLFKILQKSM